jgi:hypothetical protein
MRKAILALFVCTGTTAFSQSAPQAPITPQNLRTTPTLTLPDQDFSKSSLNGQIKNYRIKIEPLITIVAVNKVNQRWDNAKIDPKMIVHPPQSSLGAQLPGTQIAQNLYPNLQLLLIDSPSVALKAIPTELPLVKPSAK